MNDFLLIINRNKIYVYEIIDKKKSELFKIKGHRYNELNLANPESSFERLASHLLDSLNYRDLSSCKFTTIYNAVETEVLKVLSENFLPCKDWQIYKLEDILPTLMLKSDKIEVGESKTVVLDESYWLVKISQCGSFTVREAIEEDEAIRLKIDDIPKALFKDYSFITNEKEIKELEQQLKGKETQVEALKEKLEKKNDNIEELKNKLDVILGRAREIIKLKGIRPKELNKIKWNKQNLSKVFKGEKIAQIKGKNSNFYYGPNHKGVAINKMDVVSPKDGVLFRLVDDSCKVKGKHIIGVVSNELDNFIEIKKWLKSKVGVSLIKLLRAHIKLAIQ